MMQEANPIYDSATKDFSEDLKVLMAKNIESEIQTLFCIRDSKIMKRDAKIREQAEELALKDEQLVKLDEKLALKDEQLVKLDEMLALKDKQLAKLDEMLAQKDEQLAKLDEMLAKTNELLAQINVSEDEVRKVQNSR